MIATLPRLPNGTQLCEDSLDVILVCSCGLQVSELRFNGWTYEPICDHKEH